MCGCFGNICTCIYCVLYCLYCVFLSFRLWILILIYFVLSSVRTTATEWKLNCSNNNNNNNNNNIWHRQTRTNNIQDGNQKPQKTESCTQTCYGTELALSILGTRRTWLVSFITRLMYHQGQRLRFFSGRSLGGIQARSRSIREKKKFLGPVWNRTTIPRSFL